MKFVKLLILLLLLNNTYLMAFSSNSCEQYTINNLGTNNSALLKVRNIEGEVANTEGMYSCTIDVPEYKTNDMHCQVISKAIIVDSSTSTSTKDFYKCVKFYIDVNDKNPNVTIERIMNDSTFKSTFKLNTGNGDFENISSSNINVKINQLKSKNIDRASVYESGTAGISFDTPEKQNFLNNIIDTKVFDPQNYIGSMEKIKSPLSIEISPKTGEYNAEYQVCHEKIQQIPTFSLEEMLNIVKKSIFDMEGQLTGTATNLLDNVKDAVMDATSDEAMVMYGLQAISKVIAMGVCEFRKQLPEMGEVQDLISFALSNVSAKACETKLDTPDTSSSTRKGIETATEGISIGGVCIIPLPMFFNFEGDANTQANTGKQKDQCEKAKQGVQDETYEMCMQTQPDEVMECLLKNINIAAEAGNVEIDLINQCREGELKDRYTNKNYFDKLGKPYKNRITEFLNSKVNYAQGMRDTMLGYVDKTLDNLRLDSIANHQAKTYENLMEALKYDLTAKNLSDRYPNMSLDILETYSDKYKEFYNFLNTQNLNQNIMGAFNILVASTEPNANFKEVMLNSNRMMEKLLASLPLYDFYQNVFIGQDISGFFTNNGTMTNNITALGAGLNPKPLSIVFGSTNTDKYVEDVPDLSQELGDIIVENMNDYYNIWKSVIKYISKDFSFNYKSVNGQLTYVIEESEIEDVIKIGLYNVYNKRYAGKTDETGVELKNFNFTYIINRANEIETKVEELKTNAGSTTVENKKETIKYLKEYLSLILDANLYLATFDKTNANSIISIIDDTNINLQSYFTMMSGVEVEQTQVLLNNFLKLINQQ